MSGPDPRMARLARALIARLLPERDRDLLDELDELYAERLVRGRGRAGLWYARQALGFIVRLSLLRLRAGITALGAGAGPRLAVRSLRRRPAWTFGFILTLSVGAGGAAAVYAVANWVLLRPVPGVANPDRLVTVRLGSIETRRFSWRVSDADYRAFRDGIPGLTDLAGSFPVDVHVGDGAGPVLRVSAEVVTPNYFDVLGVPAHLVPGEAVLAPGLARDMGGDAQSLIGREVRINGRSVRVAGVTPEGFRGAELPGRARIFLPIDLLPLADPTSPPDAPSLGRYGLWHRMYGRLAPGATAERVDLEANALMERIRAGTRPHSLSARIFRMEAWPGVGADPAVRTSVAETLRLLAAAAALLLILAMANVANLAAMEATARRPASAIRRALGAGRGALAGQWLTEGALLGGASAFGSILVALAITGLFGIHRVDAFGASVEGLRLDGRVLGFTLLLCVLASLVAGLPIAASALRTGPAATLRAGRTAGAARLRSGLVVLQVAFAVILVAAAGLLGRTIHNLRTVDLGFPTADVTLFSIDPARAGLEDPLAVALRIEDRLNGPGARVGFIAPEPLRGMWVTMGPYRDGGVWEEDRIISAGYEVSAGFFEALGAPTLAGAPSRRDGDVTITRALAEAAYPGEPLAAVVGRLLRMPDGEALRIAHVLEDVHLEGRPEDPPPTMFRPLRLETLRSYSLTGWVRSADGPADLAAVRAAVRAESDLPVFDPMTAAAAIDLLSADRLVLARLAGLIAVLGLLLAMVGLYGALGCSVSERRHEIGVRAALGASPGRVLREIVRRGAGLAFLGGILGLGAALAAMRLLEARLFGVDPLDPATFAAAFTFVAILALLATLLPARRATRVSPISVLRAD